MVLAVCAGVEPGDALSALALAYGMGPEGWPYGVALRSGRLSKERLDLVRRVPELVWGALGLLREWAERAQREEDERGASNTRFYG